MLDVYKYKSWNWHIYRFIENLIYGNFAQEIVEKNRVDLLRTSPKEFTDNIRKIMEKDNKAQCNSSNHKMSKYKRVYIPWDVFS